jgi:ribosomal protein L32
MSVRMRHTSGHTKNRRSHHALVKTNLVVDKKTENLRLPHRLDEKTGMYKGIQVIPVKKIEKMTVRAKAITKARKENSVREEKRESVQVEKLTDDKKSEGLMGRMTLGKAKSRSGFGGGV